MLRRSIAGLTLPDADLDHEVKCACLCLNLGLV